MAADLTIKNVTVRSTEVLESKVLLTHFLLFPFLKIALKLRCHIPAQDIKKRTNFVLTSFHNQ